MDEEDQHFDVPEDKQLDVDETETNPDADDYGPDEETEPDTDEVA